jgi:curved DNA-binding protein CbpA
MQEIKAAYRQMALLLHPDRHDGDEVKTQAFKDASDAYSILSDTARRRQYDVAKFGGWSHVNSSSSRRPNYRKVYAPQAPPDGKWHDAQRHYDMHYGDGMYRDEMKRAHDKAKERGEYEYHSPLGKGFSFGTVDGTTDNVDDNTANGTQRDTEPINGYGSVHNSSNLQHNPYSKAAQGPPPQPMWLYEEGYLGEAKTVLKRKTGVTERLYARRDARKLQEEQEEQYRQAQTEQAAQEKQERTRAAMNRAMNYSSSSSSSGGGSSGASNDETIPQYQAFNQTAAAPGCCIM